MVTLLKTSHFQYFSDTLTHGQTHLSLSLKNNIFYLITEKADFLILLADATKSIMMETWRQSGINRTSMYQKMISGKCERLDVQRSDSANLSFVQAENMIQV